MKLPSFLVVASVCSPVTEDGQTPSQMGAQQTHLAKDTFINGQDTGTLTYHWFPPAPLATSMSICQRNAKHASVLSRNHFTGIILLPSAKC